MSPSSNSGSEASFRDASEHPLSVSVLTGQQEEDLRLVADTIQTKTDPSFHHFLSLLSREGLTDRVIADSLYIGPKEETRYHWRNNGRTDTWRSYLRPLSQDSSHSNVDLIKPQGEAMTVVHFASGTIVRMVEETTVHTQAKDAKGTVCTVTETNGTVIVTIVDVKEKKQKLAEVEWARYQRVTRVEQIKKKDSSAAGSFQEVQAEPSSDKHTPGR